MSLFMRWPITFLLFVILMLIVFYLMARNKKIMLIIRSVLFGFSVVVGFSLYSYSYLASGLDIPLALMRGIFNTARLFTINSDYSIFASMLGEQYLSNKLWLQILFWSLHVSALIVVQIVLISVFGRKLMDNFRLRCGGHSEVYIIKGSDKYALMLGENIATHDSTMKRSDTNRLVVFLIGEDDDEKKIREKTSHFGGIVKILDRENDLKQYLEEARLGKSCWCRKEKKYHIILMPNNISALDDVRHTLEFAEGKKISSDNLSFFVFASSAWDREKIEYIAQAKDGEKRKYPYTFHIINEIDLFVKQMITKHPPYKCQGLDFKDGIASRDFTVLILGFGTIGQSALLRLVMNGQFVGKHDESRMRAIVVDKNIDNIRDGFLHRYPALNLCCNTEFKNIDVQNASFFKLLEDTATIDYVVAATNNDGINKQMARDIRLHYERTDINALPYIAVFENDGNLLEMPEDEKIFTAGCPEEIYKESVIIGGKTDLMAKAVHEIYEQEAERAAKTENKDYKKQPWHELDLFSQESNRASAEFILAMLHLAGTDEDKAMGNDKLTENTTLAETLAQTEHLRWNAFHAAMGYKPISIEQMNQRFESCKALGFARKDSKYRLHVCLVHWDELDKIREAYRALALRTDKVDEQKRDFKENDRAIIKNIPLFLHEARKENVK